MKIVIVGPCASGTSTLAGKLRAAGYDAHACAQEHSYVPDMWRMSHPDVLIYLDARLDTIRRRRQVSWGEEHLRAEQARLAHARRHADLYLATDELTAEEVFQSVLRFLEARQASAGGQPRQHQGPGPSR